MGDDRVRRGLGDLRGGWLVVAAVVAAVGAIAGCSTTDSDDGGPGDGDGEEAMLEPVDLADRAGEPGIANLDALAKSGEVDRVVVMAPGGFARPTEHLFGPAEAKVQDVRHVLRTSSPDGPIDLFEAIVTFPGENLGPPGPQRCTLIEQGTGASMSCAPIDQQDLADLESMVVGSSGFDNTLVVELRGPKGTTHFVLELDGERVAINAVGTQALLVAAGQAGSCPRVPSVIEAWSEDQLLESEKPPVFC